MTFQKQTLIVKSYILIDKPRLQCTTKQGMQLINDPKEGNGGEAGITREH